MTTTFLNTKTSEAGNKIPDTSRLVTTTVLNTKVSEVENKFSNHAKYITTQGFNKLTIENIASILKQAKLVNKTYFDNKLIIFYRAITTKKTKYLEVQKPLNSLTTKNYNSFIGRNYLTRNDRSQNTFVYQPTLYA